jgi:hypothetical protein
LLILYSVLILYNTALGGAVGININQVLVVSSRQLRSLPSLNALQCAILLLPGRDVAFVQGQITPTQIQTLRPSYINATLIQRAGQVVSPACLQCTRRGLRPFPECRRTQGHFGGCCGNCKWHDHAAVFCTRPKSTYPYPLPSASSISG